MPVDEPSLPKCDGDVSPARPAESTALLQLDDVSRHFSRKVGLFGQRKVVRAVDHVSLELRDRRTLSVVGESGCGKTTLSQMILGLDAPTSGVVRFRGTDMSSLKGKSWKTFRTSVQAVLQDTASSLNPRRTLRQIISEPLVVNRTMSSEAIEARVKELFHSVGLSFDLAGSYPHEVSGGMQQRVAIAQALALNPVLIVLDEPVSSLDVSIGAQIMNLLKDIQREYDVSYLLIAHDLATVRYLSDDVASMYAGGVVERAPVDEFYGNAIHPYTLALISAADTLEETARHEVPRVVLRGEPSPEVPTVGCRFEDRCWLSRQLDSPSKCRTDAPPLRAVSPGHEVACHYAEHLSTREGREASFALLEKTTHDSVLAAAAAVAAGAP